MKKNLLFIGAIISSTISFGQTYFTDNFDDVNLTGWTNYDNDTDPSNTGTIDFDKWYAADFSTSFAELGTGSAVSRSWANINSVQTALHPNNFLISSAIDLTTASATGLTLKFKTGTIEAAPFHAEYYAVYVTTSNDPATIILSTPVFTETLPSDGMFSHAVSISANAGQTVYVTIRHFNTVDMNTLILDDVAVVTTSPNDAVLVSSTLKRYSLVNTNNTLAMSVRNDGSNAITSVTVDWNDGTSHSSVISCNIAAGATATVNHPTAVTYGTAQEKNLNITITNVNTTTDPNMGNNVGTKAFNTVSALVEKNVLFEEGTGTWCKWCPRGAVAMKKAYVDHPTGFIGIAVHNGDPMAVTAYDNGANFSAYPGANVDREDLGIDASTEDFDTYYASRITMVPPAAIGATITNSGATYSIVASATFKTVYSAANLRLAAIISEDDVTGTTSGYNQANAYAGNAAGVMGGFESLPNPVPAASMSYPHVGRALLGGFNGQASSVPTVITDGQVVPYTFNYTVPSTSNVANMHVVVVLIDQATGVIVNAKEFVLNPSAGLTSVSKDEFKLNVFPNPAFDLINVSFEANNSDYMLNITDIAGRTVVSNNYSNLSGTQSIAVPVNELVGGTYLLTVSTEGVSYTQQVVIK